MKIVAGSSTVIAETLLGEFIHYNGEMVNSIKLILNNDITQEQIDDLANNEWQIYDDNDVLQSTQTGYNTMHQYTVTFLKVPDIVKENETLKAQLAELQATVAALQSTTPETTGK